MAVVIPLASTGMLLQQHRAWRKHKNTGSLPIEWEIDMCYIIEVMLDIRRSPFV